jgi:hypothetical protein
LDVPSLDVLIEEVFRLNLGRQPHVADVAFPAVRLISTSGWRPTRR